MPLTLTQAELNLKEKLNPATVRSPKAKAPRMKSSSEHLSELIKALQDRGFSPTDFEKHTKIAQSTIHKWAKGDTSEPQASILEVFRKYNRFDHDSFYSYMRGGITLEELLNKRDELRSKALPQNVLLDFQTLALGDQITLLKELAEVLEASFETAKKATQQRFIELESKAESLAHEVEEYKPKTVYVELNIDEQTKLRNLIRMTLMVQSMTEQDLVEKGVSGALLKSILEARDSKFPQSDYDVLAQNLNTVIAWSSAGMPSVDFSTVAKDWEDLRGELNKK